MTQNKKTDITIGTEELKELFCQGDLAEAFRQIVKKTLQDLLEEEMNETLQAKKNERSGSRLGYRSGYYERKLITRIGCFV